MGVSLLIAAFNLSSWSFFDARIFPMVSRIVRTTHSWTTCFQSYIVV